MADLKACSFELQAEVSARSGLLSQRRFDPICGGWVIVEPELGAAEVKMEDTHLQKPNSKDNAIVAPVCA